MNGLPSVLVVGGPDVDARLELMRRLRPYFALGAAGSDPTLHNRFAAEGFPYHFYPLSRTVNPFADVRSLWRLMTIFRRARPQVVHAFTTKPCVWACIAARICGVRVVISTVTGLGSLYGSDTAGRHLTWTIYKRLRTLACRLSDLTVFQNHDDLEYFVNERMVTASKTAHIPGSGVSTEVFCAEHVGSADCDQVRKELGIGANEIVVTMISRVVRSKGVLEFAAAAANLQAHFQNVRFLLIGREDKENLDRLTLRERALLTQSVAWPGARRDIRTILRISHLFVLPTAYREGVPRVILEAASMGLPIVTTDMPGCNEAVQHGVNGILIPPHDSHALAEAIRALIVNADLRRKFGEASRRRAVDLFDSALIAEQTCAVYNRLLQRARQHASLIYAETPMDS